MSKEVKDSDLHAGRSHCSRVKNGLRTVMLKAKRLVRRMMLELWQWQQAIETPRKNSSFSPEEMSQKTPVD